MVKIDTNLQKVEIFTKEKAPEKFMTIRKLMSGWSNCETKVTDQERAINKCCLFMTGLKT